MKWEKGHYWGTTINLGVIPTLAHSLHDDLYSIRRAPIDEGNKKFVVLGNRLVTSDGLAVDWIYNHIYFTDTKNCTIEMFKTRLEGDGEAKVGKVLIRDEMKIPRAIAVNPLTGWMFWTDWGDEPKIERAGMDGTHRQAIVTRDVKWPNGLTLDLVKERVYWADAKLNMISSCNYDGGERNVVLFSIDALRHPFSITTFEDWMYWTDWDKETIFRANKFDGRDMEPINGLHMVRMDGMCSVCSRLTLPPRFCRSSHPLQAQHPMTVHVYHPYRQPDGTNYCQAMNNRCSHLCLPAPQFHANSPKISCACPAGLKLTADGLICEEGQYTNGYCKFVILTIITAQILF